MRSAHDLDSQKIFGPVRSYACSCELYLGAKYRGIVCERCGVELISNEARTTRTAHIPLLRPVIHPWYVELIAALLRITQREVRALADPRSRLEGLDVIRLEVELEQSRRTKADEAQYAAAKAFVDAIVHPSDTICELVAVWPPEAVLPSGIDRATLRAAYIALIDNPDPSRGVAALFALFSG